LVGIFLDLALLTPLTIVLYLLGTGNDREAGEGEDLFDEFDSDSESEYEVEEEEDEVGFSTETTAAAATTTSDTASAPTATATSQQLQPQRPRKTRRQVPRVRPKKIRITYTIPQAMKDAATKGVKELLQKWELVEGEHGVTLTGDKTLKDNSKAVYNKHFNGMLFVRIFFCCVRLFHNSDILKPLKTSSKTSISLVYIGLAAG
jgi:hypothetical protein